MTAKDPDLTSSRLANGSRVAQAADNTSITDWSKISPLILAIQLDEAAGPWTAAYQLRWSDLTDASVYTALVAAGECKYTDTTDLTNGNAVTSGEALCTNDPGSTWQDGEEIEDGESGSFELPDEYYTELQFALDFSDGDDGHEYGFRLYDTTHSAPVGDPAVTVTLASAAAPEPSSSDTVGAASDSPTVGPLLVEASVSDSAGVSDSPTLGDVSNPSVSDTAGAASDSPVVAMAALAPAVSDSAGASDAPTVAAPAEGCSVREIDDAASEYLYNNNGIISDEPLTICAWFKTDVDDTAQALVNLSASDTVHYRWLALDSDGTVVLRTRDGSTNDGINSTSTFTTGNWHHAAGVWSAANSRSAYLDGTNKDTSTATVNPNAPDITTVGSTQLSGFEFYYSGRIAHVAIWSTALSDEQIASLAGGACPLGIEAGSLEAYWRFAGDDEDLVKTYDLTPVNGPTFEIDECLVVCGTSVVASDSVGVTDSPALSGVPNPSVSDSAGSSDSPVARPQIAYSASDTVGAASDSASVTVPIAASASDTSGVTDSPTVTLPDALAVAESDTAAVTDSPIARPQIAVAESDSAGVTDDATVAAPFVGPREPSVSDSAGVSDSPTVAPLTGIAQASDTAGVTDSPTARPQLATSASDTAGVTDTPIVEPQEAGLTEAITSDTAGVSDSPAVAMADEAASASDTAGVTDAPSARPQIGASASDTAGASDSAITAVVLQIATSDTAGATDQVLAQYALPASASDGATVSELATLGLAALVIAASDSVAVADSPTVGVQAPVTAHQINVSDTAGVTDTVWLAALAAFKIDVALSDAAVSGVSMTDANANSLTVAESAASVAVSDNTRG